MKLSEVARIRADMEKVIAQAGYPNRFDDFVTFLRTDRRFYYTDANALVSGYRDVAKRADPELAKLFGWLPGTPYGVITVPDAIAPGEVRVNDRLLDAVLDSMTWLALPEAC